MFNDKGKTAQSIANKDSVKNSDSEKGQYFTDNGTILTDLVEMHLSQSEQVTTGVKEIYTVFQSFTP